MRRITILAIAALMAVALAAPAMAQGKPGFAGIDRPDVQCLEDGQNTLKATGLFQLAAQGKVNYALIDVNGPGVDADAVAPGIPAIDLPGGSISTELGDEAFLPLSAVFKLHLDPATAGLFAWCTD